MTYELAKQLKDAGFIHPYFQHNENWWDSVALQPTLSDLIKACGDKFWMLEIRTGQNWISMGYFNGKVLGEYGKTPEEAVAHLWLALNKK